jgi:hypothetical protein
MNTPTNTTKTPKATPLQELFAGTLSMLLQPEFQNEGKSAIWIPRSLLELSMITEYLHCQLYRAGFKHDPHTGTTAMYFRNGDDMLQLFMRFGNPAVQAEVDGRLRSVESRITLNWYSQERRKQLFTLDPATKDQLAAVMLQRGTPDQQAEALVYAYTKLADENKNG